MNPLDVIAQMEQRQHGEVKSAQSTEVIDVQYKSPDSSEFKEIKKEVNFLEHKFFINNPLYLTVDYSHTIPMRPYESAKISVGLSIPIGEELPESMRSKIDEAYKYASEYIDGKMQKEIEGVKKYLAGTKK